MKQNNMSNEYKIMVDNHDLKSWTSETFNAWNNFLHKHYFNNGKKSTFLLKL